MAAVNYLIFSSPPEKKPCCLQKYVTLYFTGGDSCGLPVDQKQFNKLQSACRGGFQRLRAESERTLNLLALVKRFPDNVEHRTALVFQLDREERAQAAYNRQRKRLCSLILGTRDPAKIQPHS